MWLGSGCFWPTNTDDRESKYVTDCIQLLYCILDFNQHIQILTSSETNTYEFTLSAVKLIANNISIFNFEMLKMSNLSPHFGMDSERIQEAHL